MHPERAVILTRGRTGSTAIVDELNTMGSIWASQELFTSHRGPDADVFKDFPAFDYWRSEHILRSLIPEKYAAQIYLREYHRKASRSRRVPMFKVLSAHLGKRPYLVGLLRENRYRIFYLARSPLQQAISGIVAKSRGVYNSRVPIAGGAKCVVNPEELLWHVNFEKTTAVEEYKKLKDQFVVHPIFYEDYIDNRHAFFASMCDRLGVPVAAPRKTQFRKMIESYDDVIENWSEIVSIVESAGLSFGREQSRSYALAFD